MGKNISHLKIGSETYDFRPYAVCTTDKYEDTKYLSIDGFQTYEGAEVTIRFTEGNLYFDGFYLSINSVSNAVQIDDTQYHAGMIFPPNVTHTFRYVAGCWQIISYTGLYETIPCEYSDLGTFTEEDLLLPGQTYKMHYTPNIRTYDADSYSDMETINGEIKIWDNRKDGYDITLTAISEDEFDDKVVASNIPSILKETKNGKWDIWFSFRPTHLATWAGYKDIHVYDAAGDEYHFNDSKRIYIKNEYYYVGWSNYDVGNTYYIKAASPKVGDTIYYWNGREYSLVRQGDVDEIRTISSNFYGVIYRLIDEWDNDCPYDFKTIYLKHEYGNVMGTRPTFDFKYMVNNPFDTCDASVYGWARNNKMGRYFKQGGGAINHNIFLFDAYTYAGYGDDYKTANNTLGPNCHNNEIWSSDNTFGSNCYGNKLLSSLTRKNNFGNECYNNTVYGMSNSFGNSCYNNIIGSSSMRSDINSFGNGCNGNTVYGNSNSFGNSCCNNKVSTSTTSSSSSNSFGNGCNGNTIGYNSSSNSFGNECRNNTFGTNTYYNNIGNHCSNISFGNYCYGNQIGNYCTYIGGGTYCFYNTYGNYCGFIYFKTSKSSTGTNRNYCYYNYVDSGVRYVVLYNTNSASSSYKLQNAHVYQGYTTGSYKYASISNNLTAKCIVRNLSDISVTLQS